MILPQARQAVGFNEIIANIVSVNIWLTVDYGRWGYYIKYLKLILKVTYNPIYEVYSLLVTAFGGLQ